ncbi:MAG: response regulator [Verrucomicrobia bacterium]|nr:response regulator [Verrucomicrobiota bacterium]
MRVLYVEDQPADADLTRRALARTAPEIELHSERTLSGAVAHLDAVAAGRCACDLILADVKLPDGSGIALLSEARERGLSLAVVMLTGSGSEAVAAEAMRAGADDYVIKSGDYLHTLPRTLHAAWTQHQAEQRRRARPLQVLLVEPDQLDADMVRLTLRRESHLRLQHVQSAGQALQVLEADPHLDVVLAEYALPDGTVLDLIKELRQRRRLELPIIVHTRAGDEEAAAQALRLGAADYVVKTPGQQQRLAWNLENAVLRAESDRHERALRESEAHFRSLIENVSDLITTLDATGRIVFQSPSVETALGRTAAEVIGQPVWPLVHPIDRKPAISAVGRTLETGAPLAFAVRLQHRDGTWRNFEVRGRRLRSGLFILNSRDVTQQIQLEAQYRHAQKLEAVGHLSAGIAHDFNNLLSIVQLNATLLKALPGEDEEMLAAIRGIDHACERAAQLTRQLLVFSRREQVRFAELELNCVVAGVAPMLARLLGEALSVRTQLAATALHTRADAGMLEQVLVNLAVNARDAMPQGGTLRLETSELTLDAEAAAALSPEARAGRFARLTVADTGAGIAPDVLPHIFEPFFTTKAAGHGTGLGLAVVYGIVKQHHGWLQVESTPGHGTSFHLYLPRTSPTAPRVQAAVAQSAPRGRGETILVVEDESGLRRIVQLTLEHFGYRVLAAATGAAALEIWRERREEIALLLTDLIMPEGMDGRELAARLTAERPELPVVFTSGYVADAARDLELVPEMNFLSKPFEGSRLAATVRRRLEEAEQRKSPLFPAPEGPK